MSEVTVKRSKGPWRFEVDYNRDRYLRSADGESIQCDTRFYPWVSRYEADWHLMAAAPEMLEALKLAELALTTPSPGDGPLVAIRAAIAKALPEEQPRGEYE